MAAIEKRISKDGKTTYRVKVRLKGFPVQSATFHRLTDAKKWVQHTEAAIREGRYFKNTESKKHTLSDAIDRYFKIVLPQKPKSIKDQKSQLSWWRKVIGHVTLADVTPALLGEQREKLGTELIDKKFNGNKKTRSAATVNRYLAALSHVFSIAVKEWGWIENNPLRNVSKLKEPRGRIRFLSNEERDRLLKACRESESSFLYLIVVLCLSTGARKMEIVGLTWDEVDLNRAVIILEDTKNGDRRVLHITGHAFALMQQHAKIRSLQSNLVFPGSNPKKPIDIRTPWENALKKAEIKDFRFHDLRHSAASYLAMNGATLAEIAEVLGHKTLQMVKRYAHLSEAHTAKIVARMNEKIFG